MLQEAFSKLTVFRKFLFSFINLLISLLKEQRLDSF